MARVMRAKRILRYLYHKISRLSTAKAISLGKIYLLFITISALSRCTAIYGAYNSHNMNDTVSNKEIKAILSAVNTLQKDMAEGFVLVDDKLVGGFKAMDQKFITLRNDMMDGFEAMDRKMDVIYEELSGKYVALKTEKADREDILSLHKRVSRLEEKLVL
jgi:hypothetical protein